MNAYGFVKFWALPGYFGSPTSPPRSPSRRTAQKQKSGGSTNTIQGQGQVSGQGPTGQGQPAQRVQSGAGQAQGQAVGQAGLEEQEPLQLQVLDMSIKVAKSIDVSPNNMYLLCVGEKRWVVS
jgi:hypothetical protein